MPKREEEREAPGLSVHQGGFAHSFNRQLLYTYSVTGTALLQTARTQKDKERRALWTQKQLASSSGLKTTPLPTLAGKPLPLTICTDGGGRGYALGRMPATSHPFRKPPDGWRSPCSRAAHQQPGPGTRDIHPPPTARGAPSAAPRSHSGSPMGRRRELTEAAQLPR